MGGLDAGRRAEVGVPGACHAQAPGHLWGIGHVERHVDWFSRRRSCYQLPCVREVIRYWLLDQDLRVGEVLGYFVADGGMRPGGRRDNDHVWVMPGYSGREVLVHRYVVSPERQRARRLRVNGCDNRGAGRMFESPNMISARYTYAHHNYL